MNRYNYSATALRGDLLASVAVMTLAIPQGMAYAMLAGVPPIAGLLASIAPPIAYAAVVRGHYLSIGPVALIALMSASGLQPLAAPGSERYLDLAAALGLEVGLLLIVLGLLRGGFIANFLGHPATIGFNGAAALLTAASQVRPLCGLPRGNATGASPTNPWPVFLHIGQAQLLPLAFGLGTIAILLFLPRFQRRVPAPLVACLAGGAVAWFVDPSLVNLETVGVVPATFPTPRLPELSVTDILALLPTAASVAIVGYGSSVAVAKAIAAKQRARIDPGRELFGIGAANLASGLLGAFPVSGSLARSVLTVGVGARTRMAGVFTAGWVAIVMLGFGRSFAFLPLAVLAGIVMHGALQLFDWREAIAIWRTHPSDAATMILTFAATLSLGLVAGLTTGIMIALLLFVKRTAAPHAAELGRIPNTLVYRNTLRFDVETCPQIGILRIDAPLYYANSRFLEDRIYQLSNDRPALMLVALECSGVGGIDATAIQTLRNVALALRAQGNDLHIIGAIGPVRDMFARTGFTDLLGDDHFHRTIVEAAPQLMGKIRRNYCEGVCTANAFAPCSTIVRSSASSPASHAAKFSPQI